MLIEYEDITGKLHWLNSLFKSSKVFSISMQMLNKKSSYSLSERQEQSGTDILDGISTEQTRLVAEVTAATITLDDQSELARFKN